MENSLSQKKYNALEKHRAQNRLLEKTEKCKAVRLAYRLAHKEEKKAYAKEYVKSGKGRAAYRKYWDSGKGVINKRTYRDRKIKSDIQFKLAASLRTRLYHAIKDEQRSGSAVNDLGCTIPELKKHIESQFEEGMSWSNWSLKGWHIDHTIPLDSFDLTDREQFINAVHFTNLKPMWAPDNIEKSNKLN